MPDVPAEKMVLDKIREHQTDLRRGAKDAQEKARLANEIAEFKWLKEHPWFEQRPATFAEFLKGNYLDIEAGIRPAIREIMVDIFGVETNPDRIACYEEALITGAVGIGKTTCASITQAYMVHWVLCLRDPQDYFGLLPGSRIAFMQMSTSAPQAREVVFSDIKARIDHSPWFRKFYPYDPKFKNQFRFPQKDIWILPGDSSETTFEGYNVLGGVLDEADSHRITKNKDYAEAGYSTIRGRITSRFGNKGFLLVIGQKKKARGFIQKMWDKMIVDSEAYTAHMTIWESFGWEKFTENGKRDSFWYDTQRYQFTTEELAEFKGFPPHILEVPNLYRKEFENHPQKALRDLAGKPPTTTSPFFHDPGKIHIARDNWRMAVNHDEGPADHNNVLADWFKARDNLKRSIHVDVAYSAKGDALGLAMGHVPEMVEVDSEVKPFIFVDLILRIKAPAGQEVILGDVRKIIYALRDDRKFNIRVCTTDGFECLSGTTVIPTLDGRMVTIAELSKKHPRGGFWTYSVDPESGKFVPGYCEKAWKVGRRRVIEVVLDNKEVVRCTPDHRFMLRDGSYREAQDLGSGDSLMPLYWRFRGDYEQVYQPGPRSRDYRKRTLSGDGFRVGHWEWTHRMVMDDKTIKGQAIHHMDENKLNNDPSNLGLMTQREHMAIHMSEWAERNEAWMNRTGIDAPRRRRDVTLSELLPYRGRPWRDAAADLGVSQDLIYSRVREAGFNGWQEFSWGVINNRSNSTPTTYRRRDRHHNHRVVAIVDRGESEDVYDLSIPGLQNFAIGQGVFVHNSTDFRQQMRKNRISTEVVSVDRSKLPYQDLHDALAEERMAIPPYVVQWQVGAELVDIVFKEISELEDLDNKIDHPTDGSKDVADALAGLTTTLMGGKSFHNRGSSIGDMMTASSGRTPLMTGMPEHPAINQHFEQVRFDVPTWRPTQ